MRIEPWRGDGTPAAFPDETWCPPPFQGLDRFLFYPRVSLAAGAAALHPGLGFHRPFGTGIST